MFETYDNKLETPAGTLSVIGNKGALTFDIDEIESGNKLKLERMVVLHVALDDMEKNVPFVLVGDVNDYRLELGSDNELSIVSQTDEPDTFVHIAVAWAQTEELAKAALFINPSA